MDKWLKHVANLLYRSQNSSYSVGLSCLFSGSVEIKLQYKVVQSSFTVELCRNLEALPRLSKRGSSEQPLGTHRETQQTLWPWNVKWQLPSKRTGGAFSLHWEVLTGSCVKHWHVDASARSHFQQHADRLAVKLTLLPEELWYSMCYWHALHSSACWTKQKRPGPLKSQKKNPWRAASNDQRWLIIHPP